MRSIRFVEFSPLKQSLGLSGNSVSDDASGQRPQSFTGGQPAFSKRCQRINKSKQALKKPKKTQWQRSKSVRSSCRRSSLITHQSRSNEFAQADPSTTPTTSVDSDPNAFRQPSSMSEENIESTQNDQNSEAEFRKLNSNLSNYIDLVNQLFITTTSTNSGHEVTEPRVVNLARKGINLKNWLESCLNQTFNSRPISRQVFLQPEITEKMRELIVLWLFGVNKMFKLHQETFFNAVELFDRCLACSSFLVDELQLLAITVLQIAAKFEDKVRFSYRDLAALSDQAFGVAGIANMEARVLALLDYNVHCFTSFDFFQMIRLFAENGHKDVNAFTGFILHLMMVQPRYLDFDVRVVAISAICFAILTTGDKKYLGVLQSAFKCFSTSWSQLDEYVACFQYIDNLIRTPIGQQFLQRFLQA